MLGLSLSPRLVQRHELRLTHAQRLEIGHRLIQTRMELAQAIHGETYNQRGECIGCDYRLTPREILEGFCDSPTDTSTQCPRCKTRFQPVLIAWGHGMATSIQVLYYCPEQTLHALNGQETKRPEELAKDLPGVYESALLHFGSLRAAFVKVGERLDRVIEYAYGDIDGWKMKVGPFLGQLLDKMIAQIVGVSPAMIRNMRKLAGINRYRASDYV